jgi:hypothetical protein
MPIDKDVLLNEDGKSKPKSTAGQGFGGPRVDRACSSQNTKDAPSSESVLDSEGAMTLMQASAEQALTPVLEQAESVVRGFQFQCDDVVEFVSDAIETDAKNLLPRLAVRTAEKLQNLDLGSDRFSLMGKHGLSFQSRLNRMGETTQRRGRVALPPGVKTVERLFLAASEQKEEATA